MKIADRGCVIMRGDTGYAYLPAEQAEIEFAKYKQQITALEKQCATLAAQIDRMTPVVDAALHWYSGKQGWGTRLAEAANTYEQQMAALAQGVE